MSRTPVEACISTFYRAASLQRTNPKRKRGKAVSLACASGLSAAPSCKEFRLPPLTGRLLLRVLLFRDVPLAAGLLERSGLFGIELRVVRPLGRDIGLGEDGFHGAFRHAGFTVDAVNRIDVQHHVVLIETL